MAKIEAVFFDAGGGHRAAATSLQMVALSQQRNWQVSLLNLQDLLDSLDVIRKLTGLRLQDAYNQMLRHGWTLGSAELLRVMHLLIRMYHKKIVAQLEQHWQASRPDMVVSLVPNFNRALCESYAQAWPGRPYVTILTDLADYPPHFWIERQKQYVICGTQRAAEQARTLGHPADRVFTTSGMILHPRFYEPRLWDRAAERTLLGLDPNLSTGIVLFGGHGSSVMTEILEKLEDASGSLQLIFICGKNEKLARQLGSRRTPLRRHIEGFTSKIPYFMHLADFLIGKPGPGSISEALAMGLPVIVERNVKTLPQERYNAEWVCENELGFVVRNFKDVDGAVNKLLEPETFTRLRANVAAAHNRAVFEIPEIIESILAQPQ
jgi:UDP-N-acetylglucosamine:LPS N-acetylglucosamine transferase